MNYESSTLLTPSDYIQIAGIISSLICALIAIFISVKTLRQTSKIAEDSARPYIGIYGLSVYVQDCYYYIVIKNFGQTSARIDDFSCDTDLNEISFKNSLTPFSNIVGASVMPGQSYRAVIDFKKVSASNKKAFNFTIKYSKGSHRYNDTFSLKIDANIGNLEAHPRCDKVPPEAIVAETLLDFHIKSL